MREESAREADRATVEAGNGEAPAVHPKSRGAARRALRRGPTIEDVAEVAGVSRGTVSRVLNGGRYVSPAAHAAVQRAMLQTGYVVNQSARSLVTRRSNCVAFVLSEPHELLFEDPNFNVLLRGCTQALAEQDVSLILMTAGSRDERERVLRYMRGGHVDGVLLISTHGGDPILGELEQSTVPVVACGRPLGHERSIPYVAAADREGARLMTEYLLGKGYQRVAIITGPLDTPGGLDRLQGYCDVMGRRTRKQLIVSATEYSHLGGEVAMTELLDRSPDLDAVFVASDLLAAGALAVLRRAGRAVPGDVAVAGFDDSRVATTTDPPLTTVRNDLDRAAAEMVRILLQRIDNLPAESLVLPAELVIRHSA